MSRKPVLITQFSGVTETNPYIDKIKFLRISGFKFAGRLGGLVSRGGWDDWGPAGFDRILGIKKWYRGDGGTNLLTFAVAALDTPKLYYYTQSNKTTTALFTYPTSINQNVPVNFIDCGNQILVLPSTVSGRPISVKLYEYGDEGGILARLLGLDPPSYTLAYITGYFNPGVNQMASKGLDQGVYQYCITFSYGSRKANTLYGESAPGPPLTVNALSAFGGWTDRGIIQIQLPVGQGIQVGSAFQKINIYRTLKGGTTFYKVGEITEIGIETYNDTMNDSLVEPSKTLPIYTGIGVGMRCGLWHKSLSRLFWFGEDGYFHFSAAGYPDVNPAYQKIAVGDLGHRGNAVITIRNNIFCLKEDGIFLVSGNSPNYFSEQINPTPCLGKNTIVNMPDGVYFLGAEGDQLKVFKFDGNNVVPISEEKIDSILGKKKTSVINSAFAVQKNEEYCLFITTSDARFCRTVVPYNNIALFYDYRIPAWSTMHCQAGCAEVFDGPGDSGEFWIGESNPDSSVSKGTFFRNEEFLNTQNLTLI